MKNLAGDSRIAGAVRALDRGGQAGDGNLRRTDVFGLRRNPEGGRRVIPPVRDCSVMFMSRSRRRLRMEPRLPAKAPGPR